MNKDIIVHLQPGEYDLSDAFALSAEDGGFNGHNVVYNSDVPGAAIISGGIGIAASQWSLNDASAGIYVAHIGAGNFKQLYENGQRANRSRYMLPVRADGNAWPIASGYNYSGGNNPLNGMSTANMEVVGMKEWMTYRCQVTGVSANSIFLNPACVAGLNSDSTATMATAYPLWAENSYGFIKNPGDWYYAADAGDLYYEPFDPASMSQDGAVVFPMASSLITISNAANIVIQGVVFQYANFATDAYYGSAGGAAVSAAVVLSASSGCSVSYNTFQNLGGDGISVLNQSSYNVIGYNQFSNIAGGAIDVGSLAASDAAAATVGNVITDNTISYIGLDYYDRSGIFGGYNDSVQITHNSISNVPYDGILLSGCGPVGCGVNEQKSSAQNNNVQGNLISDFGEILTDVGGVYMTGRQDGTWVQDNCITNMHAGYQGINDYIQAIGVYLDNGTSYTAAINNYISLSLIGYSVPVKTENTYAAKDCGDAPWAPCENNYFNNNSTTDSSVCAGAGPRQDQADGGTDGGDDGFGGDSSGGDTTPDILQITDPLALAGLTRTPDGTVYWANESGHVCNYANWNDYLLAGGTPDMSNVTQIAALPDGTIVDGVCQVNLPAGFIGTPDGSIYTSNGEGYVCGLAGWREYLLNGGAADLSNVTQVDALTSTTIYVGTCHVKVPAGFIRTADTGIYYYDGAGHACGYATGNDFYIAGGARDLSNVIEIRALPTDVTYDGTCQVNLPAGFIRTADGTIYRSNGEGRVCGLASWRQFLLSGGAADLSNVNQVDALTTTTIYVGTCKVK